MKEKLKKLIDSKNHDDIIVALRLVNGKYSGLHFRVLWFLEWVISLACPIFFFSLITLFDGKDHRGWKTIGIFQYLTIRYMFSTTHSVYHQIQTVFHKNEMQLMDEHMCITPTPFGALVCAIVTKYLENKRKKRNRAGVLADIF